jgi:hypothetical protein
MSPIADGSVRFDRLANGTVRREPTAAHDPFMVNATQYLGWFFRAENATVAGSVDADNTTTYRVVTEGDPDPRFRDVRGTVYVTGVGSTSVTAPAWVGNRTVASSA